MALSNKAAQADILGQSYEYLIRKFADLANKKALGSAGIPPHAPRPSGLALTAERRSVQLSNMPPRGHSSSDAVSSR